MKDAKGHGSDAHSTGVDAIPATAEGHIMMGGKLPTEAQTATYLKEKQQSLATIKDSIARGEGVTPWYQETHDRLQAEIDKVKGTQARFGSEEHPTAETQQLRTLVGSAPKFADYANNKAGGPYVIARNTPGNQDRYPGHKFITAGQHDKIKQQYRTEYPVAAKAYFGD